MTSVSQSIQDKIDSYLHPPVSPVPDTGVQKSVNWGIDQAKQLPYSMYRASPAGDMINRAAINSQYNPVVRDIPTLKQTLFNNKVPYNTSVNNSVDTAGHGVRAAIGAALLGLTGRPFASNPLELANGDTATLLNSGKGFSTMSRILGY